MSDQEKDPFYCIKLKTGETIFGEISEIKEDCMMVVNPFEVKGEAPTGKSVITAYPWIPYTTVESVPIPIHMVYYCGYLNNRFKKFYGSMIIQSKIAEIKESIAERLENRNDYHAMMEGIEEIEQVARELCDKFGLENNINTEDFKEEAKKFKPPVH